MIRRRGVELGERREARRAGRRHELIDVEAADRRDPFAVRQRRGFRAQRCEHVVDRSRRLEPRVVPGAKAEQHDVVVVVDQARHDRAAFEVDHARAARRARGGSCRLRRNDRRRCARSRRPCTGEFIVWILPFVTSTSRTRGRVGMAAAAPAVRRRQESQTSSRAMLSHGCCAWRPSGFGCWARTLRLNRSLKSRSSGSGLRRSRPSCYARATATFGRPSRRRMARVAFLSKIVAIGAAERCERGRATRRLDRVARASGDRVPVRAPDEPR